MKYVIKEYPSSNDDTVRFILGLEGEKRIFALGLNPSTADDKKPDRTMTKLMTFAEKDKNDGFVMMNLYPQRSRFPKDVHKIANNALHEENLKQISQILSTQKNPTILACWGETIMSNSIFRNCFMDIFAAMKQHNVTWKKIGELTKSQHPRHPSRASYNYPLTPFDIDSYILRHSFVIR